MTARSRRTQGAVRERPDVRAQVALSLYTDFENFSTFKPAPQHEKAVNAMLDQVVAWGGALKVLRK